MQMLDPILPLAHSMYNNKGVYALLLGSGVSRSAGRPAGWEIIQDLIRRLAKMEEGEPVSDPEAWYTQRFARPRTTASYWKGWPQHNSNVRPCCVRTSSPTRTNRTSLKQPQKGSS